MFFRDLRAILFSLLALSAINVGCGRTGETSATKTEQGGTSGGGQVPHNTNDECVLQFRSKQIPAINLPTNILGSNLTNLTSPGKCSLVLSGQDLIFPQPSESGNSEFFLSLSRLQIGRQARIVTNGYRLVIQAAEVISDDGQIVAFDPPRKAKDGSSPSQNGENGASGGNVELHAAVLRGNLTVDLRGQDGGDGAAGAPGVAGSRGLSGSSGVSGVFGCQSGGGNGSRGGDGSPGGRGGDGGKGGNAGNLILDIKNMSAAHINPNLDAGLGGRPGPGGPGGGPGQGGEGGSGSGFCSGGSPGQPGQPGPSGALGTEGQKGIAGQLVKR